MKWSRRAAPGPRVPASRYRYRVPAGAARCTPTRAPVWVTRYRRVPATHQPDQSESPLNKRTNGTIARYGEMYTAAPRARRAPHTSELYSLSKCRVHGQPSRDRSALRTSSPRWFDDLLREAASPTTSSARLLQLRGDHPACVPPSASLPLARGSGRGRLCRCCRRSARAVALARRHATLMLPFLMVAKSLKLPEGSLLP